MYNIIIEHAIALKVEERCENASTNEDSDAIINDIVKQESTRKRRKPRKFCSSDSEEDEGSNIFSSYLCYHCITFI